MILHSLFCYSPGEKGIASDQLWKSQYLERFTSYIIPTEDQKWGQLILAWNEKRGEQIISHTYAPWIDMEEWSGIYVDDRPLKIYAKVLMQCICRPFHMVAKTIVHLSMVPLFYEIFKTVAGEQSIKEGFTHAVRSLVDIVRTPLFGLVSLVSSIALLILSPLVPELLFSGRRFLGNLEMHANWGVKESPWILGRCFLPLEFSFLFNYDNKTHEGDTLYLSDDPLDRQLTNFARSAVHHKQTHMDITTCQTASFDVPYITPVDLAE